MNFQPASAPTFAGYPVDAGAVYGPRGDGYTFGWNANNMTATADRNSSKSPDQRYDTLIQMQQSHEPERILGGRRPERELQRARRRRRPDVALRRVQDQRRERSRDRPPPEETTRWVDRTQTVTVADGRLTISNGVGASANKLCFVEIVRVG